MMNREAIRRQKLKQVHYYNQGSKDLQQLKPTQFMRIQPHGQHKTWRKAMMTKQVGIRSYEVEIEGGIYLRRKEDNYEPQQKITTPAQLIHQQHENNQMQRPNLFQLPIESIIAQATPQLQQKPTTTRSGRTTRPPNYLKDYVTK